MTEPSAPEEAGSENVIDHNSIEWADEHIEVLADLRSRCPVAHSPLHGGYYVVTKYDDVATILHDDETFSSVLAPEIGLGGIRQPTVTERVGFLEMDPPESTEYRKSLMPLFSKASVMERVPAIERIVEDAVDSFIETGSCDLVTDLADRVPAMTTIDMLGLDPAVWKPFAEFLHGWVSDDQDAIVNAHTNDRWFFDMLADQIQDRKTKPRDDGLTWVVEREVNGKPVPDDVLLENVFLIMIGGFDPPSAFLSNSLLYLSQHPEERDRLRADPGLLESACEEMLRYFTPVLSLARTVTKDCELSGQQLHEGDRVLMAFMSANRDEDHFPDPDEVLLDRDHNRHLAFGLGSHRCMGNHIARVQFELTVKEVLERMPDYSIDEAAAVRFPRIPINNGWFSMPATFTPGPRKRPS